MNGVCDVVFDVLDLVDLICCFYEWLSGVELVEVLIVVVL